MNYLIKRLLNKFDKSKSKVSNAANWKNWVDSTNAYIIDRSDKNGETGIKILDDGTFLSKNVAVNGVHTSIPVITTTAGGVGTYTRKWGLIATVDMTKMEYGEIARIDVNIWAAATAAPYLQQETLNSLASVYIKKESNTGTQTMPFVVYKKWGPAFDLVYYFTTNSVKLYAYAKWHNTAYRIYCEADCYAKDLSAFTFAPAWTDTKPSISYVIQVKGILPCAMNSTGNSTSTHLIFDDELSIYQIFYSGLNIEYKSNTGAIVFRSVIVHGTATAETTMNFYDTQVMGGSWEIITTRGSLLSGLNITRCTCNRNLYVYPQSNINGILSIDYGNFESITLTTRVNRDFSLMNPDVNIGSLFVQYNKVNASIDLNILAVSIPDSDNTKFGHNVTVGAVTVYYNNVGTTLTLNNQNDIHSEASITGVISITYNNVGNDIILNCKSINANLPLTTVGESSGVNMKVTNPYLTQEYFADIVKKEDSFFNPNYLYYAQKVKNVTFESGTIINLEFDEAGPSGIVPAGTIVKYYPNSVNKTYNNISLEYNNTNGSIKTQFGQSIQDYIIGIWNIGNLSIINNKVNNSILTYFYSGTGGSGVTTNVRQTFNIKLINILNNNAGNNIETIFQGPTFISTNGTLGTTNVLIVNNNIAGNFINVKDTNSLANTNHKYYVTVYGRITSVENICNRLTIGGGSNSSETVPEMSTHMKVRMVEIYDNNVKQAIITCMFQIDASLGISPWINAYNNNYTLFKYLYSFLTREDGISIGNGNIYNNDLFNLENTNVIKNHKNADIVFNNAKGYDLTSSTNVLKKIYTNSLISTIANQKALFESKPISVHTSIPVIATTAGGVGTYTRKWGLIATVDLTKMSYGETARIDVDAWIAATASPYLIQQFGLTQASVYIKKESDTGTQSIPYVVYKEWAPYIDLVYYYTTNSVKIYAYAKWHNIAYRLYCEADCYAKDLSTFTFAPTWTDTKPTITGCIYVKGDLTCSNPTSGNSGETHYIFDDEISIYNSFYSGLTINYKSTTGAYSFTSVIVHGTATAEATMNFYGTQVMGGYWVIATAKGSLLNGLNITRCLCNRNLYVYPQSNINGTLYIDYGTFDAITITPTANRSYSLMNSDVTITTISVQYNKVSAGITINVTGISVADVDNSKYSHNVTVGTINAQYNILGGTLQISNQNSAQSEAHITGVVTMNYNTCGNALNFLGKSSNSNATYNTSAAVTALGATKIRFTNSAFSTAAYLADLIRVGDIVLQATYLTNGTKVTSVTLVSGTEIEVGISKPTILEIPASTAIVFYPIKNKTYNNLNVQYNNVNATILIQFGQNAGHYLNDIWTIGAISVVNNKSNNSLATYFYGGFGTLADSRERFNITSINESYNITGANVTITFQGRIFIGLATNVGTANVLTVSQNIAGISIGVTDTSPLLIAEAYVTLYGRLSVVANQVPTLTIGGSSYTTGATTPEATIQMKVPNAEFYNNNIKVLSIRYMIQSLSGNGSTVNPWMTLYNNNFVDLAYLYSFLTGANGILIGNGSAYNNDIYNVGNTNIIKNHGTADIVFNNAKAYDLTTTANVIKKTITNSVISTVNNQKSLYSNNGNFLSKEIVNILSSATGTGALVIQRNTNVPTSAGYNEGIRINRSNDGWACLILGAKKDTYEGIDPIGINTPISPTSGNMSWYVGCHPDGGRLMIGQNSSGYGGLEFNRDGKINYISTTGTKYNIVNEVITLGNTDLGISPYDQSSQNYAPFYMPSTVPRGLTLQVQGRMAILNGYLCFGANYTHINIDACQTGTFSLPNKYLPKSGSKTNVMISISLDKSGSTTQKVNTANGWFVCPADDSGSSVLNYRQSTDWPAGYHNEAFFNASWFF
jgi:hypothetical protein